MEVGDFTGSTLLGKLGICIYRCGKSGISAGAVSPLPQIRESGAKSRVLIFGTHSSSFLLSEAATIWWWSNWPPPKSTGQIGSLIHALSPSGQIGHMKLANGRNDHSPKRAGQKT